MGPTAPRSSTPPGAVGRSIQRKRCEPAPGPWMSGANHGASRSCSRRISARPNIHLTRGTTRVSLFDARCDLNPRLSKVLGVANAGAPCTGVHPKRPVRNSSPVPTLHRYGPSGRSRAFSACPALIGYCDAGIDVSGVSATSTSARTEPSRCNVSPVTTARSAYGAWGASDAEYQRRIDMARSFIFSSLLTARSHRARFLDRPWAGSPERLAWMSGLSVSVGGETGPEIVRHRHDIVRPS